MIAQLTDIRERALSRIPSKLRADPVFSSFVAGLAAGVQALEDDMWELLVLNVTNAVGAQLVQIGTWVGEPGPGGLTDAEYRRFVLARIQINKSLGTTDGAINALAALTGTDTVRQTRLVPATSILTYILDPLLTAELRARVVATMATSKPGGVARVIVEAPVGYFGFASDPDALGFGAGKLADRIT